MKPIVTIIPIIIRLSILNILILLTGRIASQPTCLMLVFDNIRIHVEKHSIPQINESQEFSNLLYLYSQTSSILFLTS